MPKYIRQKKETHRFYKLIFWKWGRNFFLPSVVHLKAYRSQSLVQAFSSFPKRIARYLFDFCNMPLMKQGVSFFVECNTNFPSFLFYQWFWKHFDAEVHYAKYNHDRYRTPECHKVQITHISENFVNNASL